MKARKTSTASAEKTAASDEPRADLGALLMRSLNDHWRVFRGQLKRCQKKGSEASVHDARVAARRLIAILDILGSVAPDDRITTLRRHVKKCRDRFGSLRDVQMQSVSLETLLPSFPELEAFQNYLAKRERRLLKRLSKQLQRVQIGRLAKAVRAIDEELRSQLGDPATQDGKRATVIAAVDAAFDKVMQRRQLVDSTDTMTIHRMRVAFKKFRYMVEALQPLFLAVTAGQLQEMHAFQTTMGDIQDGEILLASVNRFFAKKHVAAVSSQPVQEDLSRRRLALIEGFLRSAAQLVSWWKPDRPPVTSKPPTRTRRS